MTLGLARRQNQGTTEYANGDVWANTWADDGKIYALVDDPVAISGPGGITMGSAYPYVATTELSGYTDGLTARVVNAMRRWGVSGEYLGSDGAGFTWKASGLACVDGVLYAFISRHYYGTVATNWEQTAQNGQIIKSDDHGVTWTPMPAGNSQPYASPMFPGRSFAAGSFIQYGKNYAHANHHHADTYIYAVATSAWNNAADGKVLLGRCRLDLLPNLNGASWQYYAGGDGMKDSAWTSDVLQALPLITVPKRVGMTSVQYLPYCRRYVMFQWYYPSLATGTANTTSWTKWRLYEAATPWGPWNFVQEDDFNGDGFYNQSIVHKSLEINGGRDVELITAGDYSTAASYSGKYQATLLHATFHND
jgi:hypothetical protein